MTEDVSFFPLTDTAFHHIASYWKDRFRDAAASHYADSFVRAGIRPSKETVSSVLRKTIWRDDTGDLPTMIQKLVRERLPK